MRTAAGTTRLARPDEAVLVRELSAQGYVPAYLPVIGAVPRPASEDRAIRVAAGQVWLLHEGGMAVAVLVLVLVLVLVPGPEHLMVHSGAVRPAHQGRGLARRLLAFAAQRALAVGRREPPHDTNPRRERNVALHRACGCRETGRRPHPSHAGEVLVDTARIGGPQEGGVRSKAGSASPIPRQPGRPHPPGRQAR